MRRRLYKNTERQANTCIRQYTTPPTWVKKTICEPSSTKAFRQILPTPKNGHITTKLEQLPSDARTAVYPIANINDPYARRVLEAGGFRRYERAHLTALTATFAPKFPALPTDAVRVVVAFCFHVGYY